MKLHEIYHGFEVHEITPLPEQNATLYRLVYQKNGCELVWLKNEEKNKLFSIAFKTVPTDDTGVFHILEHSVLCGSKKYPVKEPFVEMIKSSMNTFLNAITFSDKTVYPIASRNETDFFNLMQVYLDAVFSPAIYENPNIFYQEGWHYDLHDPEEIPSYKGVVFNEMKGAFSSVDQQIERGILRMLFPDTCYGFESGGDPKKIPELSFEQFLSAHRNYYHPSNAKIYVDGQVPFERVLTILDERLLSYEVAPQPQIPYQPPASSEERVDYYEIGEGEVPDQKAQMVLGKLLCDYTDRKKVFALMVLGDYLTGSNEAPLKRAILQKGLGQDVIFSVMDGIAQPYYQIRVSNTEYDRRDLIKNVLRETARSLLEKGLDQEELNAGIDQLEFRVREGDEPQGLWRNINALSFWLYGGNPAEPLQYDRLFRSLREAVHTTYFEELLRYCLLDEDYRVTLYLLPSKIKGQEDARAEMDALAAKKAAWSHKELENILEQNRRLQAWQSQPDSPEALATLPALPLSEVSPVPEQIPTESLLWGDVPVYYHRVSESGVVHFSLYFSLANCPLEYLGALSFLTRLLGYLPTKRHSVLELQQEMKRSTGFLDYNVVAFPVLGEKDQCKPYFMVTCSALKSRLPDAVILLHEILSDTLFEGEASTSAIHENLLQCQEMIRQSITENGHRYAYMRALSHFSAPAWVKEQTKGFTFYQYLSRFVSDFERQIHEFQRYANWMQETQLVAERMTVSVTADEDYEDLRALPEILKKGVNAIPTDTVKILTDQQPVKEVIQIPAGVSYAVSAGHLDRYGIPYTGSLRILASILSFDYLWNQVRVRGGAYGCGFQADMTGQVGFHSYRDPSPLRSLSVYNQAAAFVHDFCQSGESIDKYIISTVAATEPLEILREQALRADARAMSGITMADQVRIRTQMLQTKKEDLRALVTLFEKMAEQNAVCIVGNREAVKDLGEEWSKLSL